MEYVLPSLKVKQEVDEVIMYTEEKVVVLRFGLASDPGCMQTDNVMLKTQDLLSKIAVLYTVDIHSVPIYVEYFEIEHIPATVFFFNGQHIKVDCGSPDHTKFIGPFLSKQDFIDLVETVYRGAMSGKYIVSSPFDNRKNVKYDLVYKNI